MKRISLHEIVGKLREKEKAWKEANPTAHPVELYKALAQAAVKKAIELGAKENGVYVYPAVFAGGVPEYSYTIDLLAESGIEIKTIDGFHPVR